MTRLNPVPPAPTSLERILTPPRPPLAQLSRKRHSASEGRRRRQLTTPAWDTTRCVNKAGEGIVAPSALPARLQFRRGASRCHPARPHPSPSATRARPHPSPSATRAMCALQTRNRWPSRDRLRVVHHSRPLNTRLITRATNECIKWPTECAPAENDRSCRQG